MKRPAARAAFVQSLAIFCTLALGSGVRAQDAASVGEAPTNGDPADAAGSSDAPDEDAKSGSAPNENADAEKEVKEKEVREVLDEDSRGSGATSAESIGEERPSIPPEAPKTEAPKTEAPEKQEHGSFDGNRKTQAIDAKLPAPDQAPRFDFWATAAAVTGCVICSIPTVGLGGGLIVLGGFLIAASLQAGGCGAIFGVLAGILLAIFGVAPLSLTGVASPLGTLVGGSSARFFADRTLWPTLLGPLLGLVTGLASLAGVVGLTAIVMRNVDNNGSEEWLLPVLVGGAAAVIALALLSGPIALAGSVVGMAVWPGEEVRRAPDERIQDDARSHQVLLSQSAANAAARSETSPLGATAVAYQKMRYRP